MLTSYAGCEWAYALLSSVLVVHLHFGTDDGLQRSAFGGLLGEYLLLSGIHCH